MKKSAIIAMATGLVLALGSTALAASANDVQTLEKQVREKLQSVQAESLSDAQKEALKGVLGGREDKELTEEQKAQRQAAQAEREAQVQAFKAMLTDEQAAAYDAMTPAKPVEGQAADGLAIIKARPTDAEMQAMKTQREAFEATLSEAQKTAYDALFTRKMETKTLTAEEKAQMDAKHAEREAKVQAFKAMLTTEQAAAYDAMTPAKPSEGQTSADGLVIAKIRLTDAEMQAMKAQREAFAATLSEAQKAAYDELGFGKGLMRLENMTQEQLDQRASDLQKALDLLNSIAS